MSEHVSETCNESSGLWLPLTEYSVKSGVSLSTIRRKIKSNSIPYRLENGRYLVLFDSNGVMRTTSVMPPRETKVAEAPVRQTSPEKPKPKETQKEELSLLERSVEMLSEAFEYATKEKDLRIELLERRTQDLEERVMELRLLVHVLEEKYRVRY